MKSAAMTTAIFVVGGWERCRTQSWRRTGTRLAYIVPVALIVAIIKRIRSSNPLPCTYPALHCLVDVLTDVQATELDWLKWNKFHETIG